LAKTNLNHTLHVGLWIFLELFIIPNIAIIIPNIQKNIFGIIMGNIWNYLAVFGIINNSKYP